MSNEPNSNEALNYVENDPTKNMNNFYLLFPASEGIVSSFADIRRLTKERGMEEKRIGDDFSEEKERIDHSLKWLNQTYREFFKEIDQVTAEKGLSLEEIKQMRDTLAQEKDYGKREKLRQELNEKLKPIFERLLKEGYKPYDLSI